MPVVLLLEMFAGCALASAAATGIVLWWLSRHQILDHPNERSSHDRPTPRGGGLAVIPVVALAWSALALFDLVPDPLPTLGIAAGALVLGAIGWRDDRVGLPILFRLGAQLVVIAGGLFCLPGAGTVFQGLLPVWLDLLATALVWAWFVNLYNFMDGIDGITGAQTVVLGLGVAAVTFVADDQQSGGLFLGLALAAAAIGFLPWNWQPARLFLGDVGSVPLGFLAGFLLLGLAGRGHWAPAVILPLYYLADATLTLLHRSLRFERIWRAHREHVYQQAAQLGRTHGEIVVRILAANLVLILLALVAGLWPVAGAAAVIGAIVVVVVLMINLLRNPEALPPA
jgi:UDP-N-acetylmuramyl pentapeptide phosphotransferase/UDP-N-acetylglucosamine-1-phosphate transferase